MPPYILMPHMFGCHTKIKPEHWVYSLMGRFRIFYGSIKIFEFILIIVLIILFIVYQIQQLISNIDS